MADGVALLAGLLDGPDPAGVGRDDFDGPHGLALREWQRLGFLAAAPAAHPAPSCPHCGEGVPYLVRGRYLCPCCLCAVAREDLLLWPLDRGAVLHWLAAELHIRGKPQQIDAVLWHLGTWEGDDVRAVFYRRPGQVSEAGRMRLRAYRRVLVLSGRGLLPVADGCRGSSLTLLDLLRGAGPLAVRNLREVLRPRGNVRFDAHSGALWAGVVIGSTSKATVGTEFRSTVPG